MADKEKDKGRVSENQRFTYIGFEVFPGKPKDLFKSDKEKANLVEAVIAKRDSGQIIREQCTLFENRVTGLDKIVMSITCLVLIMTLFVPWYSVYDIRADEPVVPIEEPVAVVTDSLGADSLLADSVAALAVADGVATEADAAAVETVEADAVAGDLADSTALAAIDAAVDKPFVSAKEEVLHSYVAKKKITREYTRLSGIGAIFSLGSVGAFIFSSGFILMLTGVIFLLYTLLCIGLPAYTLYGLYGVKGTADQQALIFKKIAKYNWAPVILFFLAMLLSFVGSSYGVGPEGLFASLGDAYGPGVFLGSISWGIVVSMAGFILLAAKGSEI